LGGGSTITVKTTTFVFGKKKSQVYARKVNIRGPTITHTNPGEREDGQTKTKKGWQPKQKEMGDFFWKKKHLKKKRPLN